VRAAATRPWPAMFPQRSIPRRGVRAQRSGHRSRPPTTAAHASGTAIDRLPPATERHARAESTRDSGRRRRSKGSPDRPRIQKTASDCARPFCRRTKEHQSGPAAAETDGFTIAPAAPAAKWRHGHQPTASAARLHPRRS
jgi:hypothetical protein